MRLVKEGNVPGPEIRSGDCGFLFLPSIYKEPLKPENLKAGLSSRELDTLFESGKDYSSREGSIMALVWIHGECIRSVKDPVSG